MSEVVEFASELLEAAKAFLNKAKQLTDDTDVQAHLRSAALHATSFLECHVNNISDEFSDRREFTLHERALLLEKEVRLRNGVFELGNTKYYRLEERVLFILSKFTERDFKSHPWWGNSLNLMQSRNDIAHPRDRVTLRIDDVERGLLGCIDLVDYLVKSVYKKGLPEAGYRLDTAVEF
jgi:hypothetical protein